MFSGDRRTGGHRGGHPPPPVPAWPQSGRANGSPAPGPAGGLPESRRPERRLVGQLPHGAPARGYPPPPVGSSGSQRCQLWSRPQKHTHSVQPGRTKALDGPTAGTGYHPRASSRAAGVSLDSTIRSLSPGRPGCSWSSPSFRRPAGAAFISRVPVLIGNFIPPIDKPSRQVYNHSTPPPGGVIAACSLSGGAAAYRRQTPS